MHSEERRPPAGASGLPRGTGSAAWAEACLLCVPESRGRHRPSHVTSDTSKEKTHDAADNNVTKLICCTGSKTRFSSDPVSS